MTFTTDFLFGHSLCALPSLGLFHYSTRHKQTDRCLEVGTYHFPTTSKLPPSLGVDLTLALSTALFAILALIEKVLEFCRKMVKKITYSRRHPEKKRQAPFDFDLTHEDESDRKRTKVNGESDESQLPTPPSGRQGKKAPASKNGAFSGPVSIPEDMDLEPLAESGKNLRVFKKVLNSGRYQAARPHDDNIQEDREQFVEMLMNGRKRKSHLPTPPAEAQKKAHQQTREGDTAMQLNGSAVKGELKSLKASPTSRTSQLFERIIKNEQPRVPYQPRAYRAAETAAPRKTIDGDLLSRNSREAHM